MRTKLIDINFAENETESVVLEEKATSKPSSGKHHVGNGTEGADDPLHKKKWHQNTKTIEIFIPTWSCNVEDLELWKKT